MSTAYRKNRKARKRALDAADPERRQVRNLIKRGKAPRLTMAQDAKGKLIQRGVYRLKPTSTKKKGKRVFVMRMNKLIRYTFGAILANKAATNSK